jgi:aminoglycoside/choline kinase family phosphotransferase
VANWAKYDNMTLVKEALAKVSKENAKDYADRGWKAIKKAKGKSEVDRFRPVAAHQ